MQFKTVVYLLAAVELVSAHTNFHGLWVGPKSKVGTTDWHCTRQVNSNNPITNYMSPDMVCNQFSGPAAQTCAGKSVPNLAFSQYQHILTKPPANPGDVVTMVWHEHNMQETDAVGGAHYGPIQAYMAKVSSITVTSDDYQSLTLPPDT
jgi:cellulase